MTDSFFGANFMSRGRSAQADYPPDRCTTPDEKMLLSRQDRVHGDHPDHLAFQDEISAGMWQKAEQRATLPKQVERYSLPLNEMRSKKLFRGVLVSPNTMRSLESLPSGPAAHTELATAMLANSETGLCSTTTFPPVADSFMRTKQSMMFKMLMSGVQSTPDTCTVPAQIDITLDPERPPLGYAMPKNLEHNGDPALHEIQLAAHNRFRVTSVTTGTDNAFARISIMASAPDAPPR